MLAPFGPKNEKATQDEGGGDGRRVEQRGLDRLAESEAKPGQRHKGDDNIDGKPLCGPLVQQTGQHGADLRPVLPAHRQDGPGLDDDFEQLAALVVEIEQIADQNQVTGRRNGQKFGQPFDDAKNKRFEQEQEIHNRAFGKKGRILT